MSIQTRLGRNIRKLRESKKMSQEELGFEADLDRTYVSGVERGVRNPTILVLEKFAKALGVGVGKLVE
ncbi:MAG: helix-turn-helix domain-containing protein [Dongiaceae bacterium]